MYSFVEIDERFLKNPTTAGEIIYNFLEQQIIISEKLYENDNKGLGKIAFRFLLPYIAYNVELKDKDYFTENELIKYINDFKEPLKKNQVGTNKFISERAFYNFYTEDKENPITPPPDKKLIKLCTEDICIVKKIQNKGYEFNHQHFRDIFSVIHIMNQMKLNDKSVFTERYLPFYILKMLSEILQEHKYNKNGVKSSC